MVKALETCGGAGRGAHGPSMAAARTVISARERAGELFGCPPERVAFTSNATEALNEAVSGVLGENSRACTTVFDHNSVLRPLYRLQNMGLRLDIAGMDEAGGPDYGELERMAKGADAVICTHMSNVTGRIVDIERIGRFCKDSGALFIVDAAQSAGLLPIDMERQHIDILCFTGHKSLYGPQGTGGICVREGIEVRPLKVGGSGVKSFMKSHPPDMPEALEAGTLNCPGIAGLCAGMEYVAENGTSVLMSRAKELSEMFASQMSRIPGVTVYGGERSLCGPTVALNIDGMDSGEVSGLLWRDYGICTRSGAHCAPLLHKALGTEERGIVRFAFSPLNTAAETEKAVKAVGEIADYGA